MRIDLGLGKLKDPLYFIPIKYKLPLAFGLLCIATFGVGGIVISNTAKEALEEQIDGRLRDSLKTDAIIAERCFELLGRRAQDFASDGYIRTEHERLTKLRAESRGADKSPEDDESFETVYAELRRHFVENKLAIVPEFVDAELLDTEGIGVITVVADELPGARSIPSDALAFGPFNGPTETHPYPTFIVSTPIKSIVGDRRIGTLQILINATEFFLRLSGAMNGIAGIEERVWIEDSAGTSIEISRTPGEAKGMTSTQGSVHGAEGDSLTHDAAVGSYGFTLTKVVNLRKAMAPITELLNQFLFFGGYILLMTIVLLFFPVKFLIGPLSDLRDAAKMVADGQFKVRVNTDSTDEIGEVSQAFNTMAQAVEERTKTLEETAETLRRKEADIRFERDRLGAVIRSMQDGLMFITNEGEVALSNAAAEPVASLMRSKKDAITQHDCAREVPEAPSCLACLADLHRPSKSCEVDIGGRTYEIFASTIPTESGDSAGRILVSRDITDRIAQQERQADHERKAVVGEISAVVAHELNNPLSAIAMFGQMLEGKLRGTELEEHASVIRRNTESCRRTIRGLLDMAGSSKPEITRFRIRDVIDDVLALLQPMFDRADANLEVLRETDDDEIEWDELHLRQVFLNLLMNSVQSKTSGIEIRIVVRDSAPAKQGEVRGIDVLVEDSGPGIPHEVSARIFEPFFTTKPPGVGTGLGLSTSRRIVESYGGALTLESSEPGRTVFAIFLRKAG
ncbi:MAG: ATP-binding protein [Planctomycetes bacterium]|nr:ATP-binding protein [Planctomycetota bacterium]